MDVVYILGPNIDSHDQELRYSLRSLKNLVYDRVHFIGGSPEWMRLAKHTYSPQRGTKWDNSRSNIRTIAEHPDISDQFILMNDDFFILEPTPHIPLYNRGKLKDVLAQRQPLNGYWQRGQNALTSLQSYGISDPLCFEMHLPAVFNKKRLARYLKLGLINDTQFLRTMYFNLTGEPSTFRFDVKIDDFEKGVANDFVSTTDRFGRSAKFFAFIHRRFPEPCYYEGV
jgi:hypothetical protein